MTHGSRCGRARNKDALLRSQILMRNTVTRGKPTPWGQGAGACGSFVLVHISMLVQVRDHGRCPCEGPVHSCEAVLDRPGLEPNLRAHSGKLRMRQGILLRVSGSQGFLYRANPHPLLIKGPPPFFFAIWQLGGSRWSQKCPTGCENDLPTRQTPLCELSKIIPNREV